MNVLRSSGLWVLLGLLSLGILLWLLGGMITVGQPPQPLGAGLRLIMIGVLYTGAGLVALLFLIMHRKKNTELLNSIADTTSSDAKSQQTLEEEKQLKEKFSTAVAQLKVKRFSGAANSSVSLYQLPWYVIIGSPGSGKTTAIRQSGLEFPLEAMTGGASLGGVGGTRNCDWWITNDAVLLDTAGRYTTQDSQQATDARGWLNFLTLLKKYRKRRPINGALVALGMDEILSMSAEQRLRHSQILRARLDELRNHLKVDFPVYLLITKADLLVGFREYFDQMYPEEQDQVWGVTFQSIGFDVTAVKSEFNLLCQNLFTQLPARMNGERDFLRRQTMLNFPWQFDNLQPTLLDFLSQIFGQQGMAASHQLRGMYFTSAVQQGSPIDRMVAGVAAKFGVRGNYSSLQKTSRSLFLKKMFREVIFQESNLAGTNPQQERKIRVIRFAAFCGIAGLAMLLALGWTGAFAAQKKYLGEINNSVQHYLGLNTKEESFEEYLASIKLVEDASKVYSNEEHPWLSNAGMYDSGVDESAKSAYLRALDQGYVAFLANNIVIWFANNDQRSFDETFNALKFYLMLVEPQHRDIEFMSAWLAENPVTGTDAEVGAELARQLTNLYALKKDFSLQSPDLKAIKNIQAMLSAIEPAERIYAQIKNDFSEKKIDFRPKLGLFFDTLYSANPANALVVPFIFTQEGYKVIDLSPGSSYIDQYSADIWVLGQPDSKLGDADRDAISESLQRQYTRDYIATWQTLISSINLRSIGTETDLVNALTKVSDPVESPLLAIIRLIVNQTDLKEKPSAEKKVISGALKKLGKESQANKLLAAVDTPASEPIILAVKRNFADIHRLVVGAPAGKDSQIIAQLSELKQSINAAYLSEDASSAVMQLGANTIPAKKTLMLAAELPAPFNAWVAAMARQASGQLSSAANGAVNNLVRQSLSGQCQKITRGMFPFEPQSAQSVSFNEFVDYFKPNGIEDAFVRANLEKHLDRALWKAKVGSEIAISSATLSMLQTGQQIREAYFGTGAAFPQIVVRIKPVSMDPNIKEFALQVGDKRILYSHGPKLQSDVEWNGNIGQVQLAFKDLNDMNSVQNFEGPWSLHRAISSGSVTSDDSGKLNVTFSNGPNKVTFQFVTNARQNPFDPRLLSSYRCRESL